MVNTRSRLLLFRIFLIVILIAGVEAIGYLGMWFNSRSFDYASNKNYFQIRAMLMGDKKPEHFPRYLSVPFLGYIPYPGYKKNGITQHNEDGYRGNKVPFLKSGKLRILCLGGSTTYGSTVDSPSEAYPARLEVLLTNYLVHDSILGKKYKGVEIINAGLESGTSAEELQQYLFKYRYYKPHIVIVHSGVNDAELVANASSDYQPDYEDARRLSFCLEPLTLSGRWLLKSYFLSFMTIQLFYDNFADKRITEPHWYSRQENQQFCKWAHIDIDSIIAQKQYEFYPFYRNSKSLFESVVSDGAILLVFPNALNEKSEFIKSHKKYNETNTLNASLSKLLSDGCGGVYVPFYFDSIRDPACWVDDCHLNAKGEENKAEILFNVLIKESKSL